MTTWDWTLPQALRNHLQNQWQQSQHFGLLLDKFSPSSGTYQVHKKHKPPETVQLSFGKDGFKQLWLNEWIDTHTFPDFIKHHIQRWQAMVTGTGGTQYTLTTASPLIVGLGIGHVLETGIILDRNTGMPLIPGSVLKGLARNLGLIKVAQAVLEAPQLADLADLEAEIEQGKREGFSKQKETPDFNIVKLFVHIFGTPKSIGNVVFVDAIYAGTEKPSYHLDIMNPHFPKYYGGDTPPSDDQSPIPVPYLTVATGQHFHFALLPRRSNMPNSIDTAWTWLKEGLTDFGVGAKTSQGYGLFTTLHKEK